MGSSPIPGTEIKKQALCLFFNFGYGTRSSIEILNDRSEIKYPIGVLKL